MERKYLRNQGENETYNQKNDSCFVYCNLITIIFILDVDNMYVTLTLHILILCKWREQHGEIT